MISAVDEHTISRIKKLSADNVDSASLLHRWQLKAIRQCLKSVRQNNKSHYGKKFESINVQNLDDNALMRSLPFTLPEDITSAPDNFLCVPAKAIERVTTLTSSGTMGAPKRIYFTANDLLRTVDFFAHGMIPIVSGIKKVAIVLSADTPNSVANLLSKALLDIGAEPFICNLNSTFDNTSSLKECGCFVGAPVNLLMLSHRYTHWRPESVLLSTDYIPAPIMDRLEANWRCQIFTHYGMTEAGFGSAVQCHKRTEHHIRHSEMLIEIIDPLTGIPLPPESEGEIVITMFANEAMPLIRYRTGDIGSLTNSACACGGFFPRLGTINGRLPKGELPFSMQELDDILFSDGSLINYSAKAIPQKQELLLELEGTGTLCNDIEQKIQSFCSSRGFLAKFHYKDQLTEEFIQSKRYIKIIDRAT